MEIARFHSCDTWEADTRWMSGTCENMASKISPCMGALSSLSSMHVAICVGYASSVCSFLLQSNTSSLKVWIVRYL